MMVGEQPGDQEDRADRPFVGPAGKLLTRALDNANINNADVYITNAVKHFKWEPRGKRRIHKKPNTLEISACRPWLDAEITVVNPEVIVCLGATAAQALLGMRSDLVFVTNDAVSNRFLLCRVICLSARKSHDDSYSMNATINMLLNGVGRP